MQILKNGVVTVMLCASLFLSACGYMNNQDADDPFSIVLDDHVDVVNAVAYDVVEHLSSIYPPGHTVFHLSAGSKKTNLTFSPIFENLLRQKAFAISTTASPDAITLNYFLDVVGSMRGSPEPWFWYIYFGTSDGQGYTRIYDEYGSPEGGFTKIQLPLNNMGVNTSYDSYGEATGENPY